MKQKKTSKDSLDCVSWTNKLDTKDKFKVGCNTHDMIKNKKKRCHGC